MTDSLTKRERSKINLKQSHEVRYWTKHLNISKEDLQKVIKSLEIRPPLYAKKWRWG